MDVLELAPGLWRWTADGAACFYAEADDATLLIDPLLPAGEEERFWRALDRDVERRGVPVAVLLTGAAHARSAAEVAGRYDGTISAGLRPGEVAAGGVGGVGVEEAVALWLPSHRALAVGELLASAPPAEALRAWRALEPAHVLAAYGPATL